jgi:D-alanyl-D-alanine-carboxypeptidase/D-alanyl-D-alanine-endopeptidase
MNKVLCLVLTTFLLLNYQFGNSQAAKTSLDSLAMKLANKLITEKQAVGISIGIYTNGKTHFYNAGSTTMEETISPAQNTVYEIGSITKTFVSLILANAVIEKKLALDDDIRKYLKESFPNLEYNGNPIRLVHLANTTSLLPDWLPELPAEMKLLSPDSALQFKIAHYRNFTRKDFFSALHLVKLDTIPGTKRYHSNAGAQLLAWILEDVYGMPMEKLIKKYISMPLKMNNTAFISAKKNKLLATGYTATGKKAVYENVMPYFQNAGGMGSSIQDLVKYIQFYLERKNEAANLALKKTIDIDASSGKIAKLRPENIAAPEVYSAALNWFKYQPTDSSSQIWADGGTNGFNSYLVLYPYSNSGIIILANKSDEKIFRALPGIAYELSKTFGKK